MKNNSLSSKISFVETNHLVLPSHINALGTLFGGVLMSWIDIAAAISAQRYSGHVCVTASVDSLTFLAPISVGETVTLKSRVIFTGRTSMMVQVQVTSTSPGMLKERHCVTAYVSLVALNDKRKPTPIRPLKTTTALEKKLFRFAAERRQFLLDKAPE